METGQAAPRAVAELRRRLDPRSLRAAWWTLLAARRTQRRLEHEGLEGALALDPPPRLPARAERGVDAVLRRRGDTCLVRSIVKQAWYAGQGEQRELIVGVTAPGDPFGAHAWLDGEPPHGAREDEFHELLRRRYVGAR